MMPRLIDRYSCTVDEFFSETNVETIGYERFMLAIRW